MMRLNSRQLIQIIATACLFVAGDLGDFIQSRPRVLACRKFHAVLDNSIHVIIGLLSWTVVDPSSFLNCSPELILVGIGSSVIDLDHFLAARSFRVSAAMHPPHRGILHCSGVLLIVALILLYFDRMDLMLVLLVCFIPHHLRDSTRRGIYVFLPYVHTPPLPMFLVRLLITIFPWVIWSIKSKATKDTTNKFLFTGFTV